MPKIGLVTFISNLITLRKMRGLTQEEVATLANISLRKYQRLENSEATPSLNDIYNLSNVLGVDASFFLNTADICNNTIGVRREKVVEDNDPHAMLFLQLLDEHILPKYAHNNSKTTNTDEIIKDETFINHKLPLGFTNFKMVVFNKEYAEKRNGVALSYTSYIGENFKDPFKIIHHFNHILRLKEDFYYFHSHETENDYKTKSGRVLGFTHRKSENFFAIITKLKQQLPQAQL